MKRIYAGAAVLALFVFCCVSVSRAAPPAHEILDAVDDLYRSSSSSGRVTMRIVNKNWQRELTMDMWSKGKDRSLIRILSPKKEKGTATLRAGNEIWNYLPKVKRVIKLPSSMMSDSWMGSHFTNDDLVKESRMADDYEYGINFEGEREGARVVSIACTPLPDAAVVWGRIDVTVDAATLIPVKIDYFNEDLELTRTMEFSDIKEFGGRKVPSVMTIRPADEPDEKTVVIYERLEFDVDLDDGIFSLRNLQK
ncbi:MAG TPA: outer membrane lipoprotein-sorting protein [bacterium]|nr:outer membrane lipoprotein-sorting protein [bacterium]